MNPKTIIQKLENKSFSMAVSQDKTRPTRIAVGDMLFKKRKGEIKVYSLFDKNVNVKKTTRFRYMPTKVMWSPSETLHELFASTTDKLYLWKKKNQKYVKKKTFIPKQIFPDTLSPIPSFDWSTTCINRIITASCDSSCTQWDIAEGKQILKLTTNDKEVFDVCFSANPSIFATASADDTIRAFDLRTTRSSLILLEEKNGGMFFRVKWNQLDTNYLAVFGFRHEHTTILDARMPTCPVALLYMENNVSDIKWMLNSAPHLITADLSQVKIWNISDSTMKETYDASYVYKQKLIKKEKIEQIQLSPNLENQLAIGTQKRIIVIPF